MALYRNVSLTFWSDSKVYEDFNISERYMFLYLLTNTHTSISGCYELGMKQVMNETGLDDGEIEKVLRSLEQKHNVIRYNASNKEVLLLNWHKHNWSSSEKLIQSVKKDIERIKTPAFANYLTSLLNGGTPIDRGANSDGPPIETTITITNTITNTDTDTNTKKQDISKDILEYFNLVTGKNLKSESALSLIRGRLRDGFSADDFKTVIDKKYQKWKGTDMEEYIRPSTLFAKSHFEEYLNETGDRRQSKKDKIKNRVKEVDDW